MKKLYHLLYLVIPFCFLLIGIFNSSSYAKHEDIPNLVTAISKSEGSVKSSDLKTAIIVELEKFEAKLDGINIQITWNTIAENNSDLFEVERSQDGAEWEVLSRIKALNQNIAQKKYFFVDLNPGLHKNIYRLKMIDPAGKYTYSSEVEVFVNNEKEFEVFNIMDSGKVIYKTNKALNVKKISLINEQGRVILQSKLKKTIRIDQFPPGQYEVLLLCESGKKIKEEFVKSR